MLNWICIAAGWSCLDGPEPPQRTIAQKQTAATASAAGAGQPEPPGGAAAAWRKSAEPGCTDKRADCTARKAGRADQPPKHAGCTACAAGTGGAADSPGSRRGAAGHSAGSIPVLPNRPGAEPAGAAPENFLE